MPISAVPDTGHGASVTFTTTGGTWKARKITMPERRLPMVDTTYLGTTTMRTMMAGDLSEWSAPVIEILFQGQQGLPSVGTSETITITLPIPGGGAATAPTLAGTGIISRVKYPSLETNTLQVAEIEFTYDGATPPAWTAAT
jgi:hypothetical protein